MYEEIKMEISTLIYGIILAIILFLVYIAICQRRHWRVRKIPYMDASFLVGINWPLFTRKISFPKNAEYLYNYHPNARYYGTFDFNTPVIVVKDPELVREIFVKNFDHFPDHRSFVSEEMDPVVGRNVFSLKGQRWRDVRSTLSPSFTANKMKFMFRLISECSRNIVDYYANHPVEARNIEAKDVFTRYTNDVIASAAFGIQVNSMRDRDNEFYLHGKDATSFGTPLRLLKFMLFRICPSLIRMSGEKFLSRATDKFFNQLVTNTVRTRTEEGIVRPDMIQLMMQAMDRDGGIEVTIEDIIGQAFIFFLAGFDTSSTLMCFVAYELAAHPAIQEKLHEEVDRQLEQEGGEVTYECLGKMKYLDMVVSEALRMYPPMPLTDRVCVREFVLPPSMDGHPPHKVEVGTNILLPIIGFHRDPKYFPDPDKFIPERFNDENKDNINQYAYVPFGLGPRKCIGNRFALMETKALIVNILKKFDIKLTERSKYPVVFCKKTFNLNIDGGFWIALEERKKKK